MKSLVICCLILFLAACGNVANPVPSPTSTSKVIETAVSQKPTPLPTATTNPTSTSTPTSTKTPLPTPTKTSSPPPTLTPLPESEILNDYESPDGEWLAILQREFDSQHTHHYTFRVVNQTNGAEWIVESFEHNEYSIIGYNLRIPIHWSENFMYFIHNGIGDGCGPFIFGYDLYRTNLQNGKTDELVAKGHWFTIAPNETKAAYILDENLMLLDLATNEEVIIELNYDPTIEYINFSDTIWSPDSSSVLVLGAEDICATGLLFEESYHIISQIDAHSYQQTEIIQDPSLRRILNWTELNRVKIYADMEEAWLNIGTGEIEP